VRYRLFPADELSIGDIRSVRIGPVDVALMKAPSGHIFALRDSCAHNGALLSRGRLGPLVVSNGPGNYERDDSRCAVRCPWHGFEFDVETGLCPADPTRFRVRVYPVSIEDGFVVVER
jgi:nitrite reductase (NADH) small subunit